ncbi:GlsB/YeaQ/YmgE family stress response membrane protein, partial [Mesorhizobium sp. M7A.T.Ca.TU.009.01.3.2]
GFSIGGGTLAAIIHATIGAIILLVLVKVLKRA